METPKFPPFFPIFLSGVILAGAGLAGLAYVIFGTDPELGYRWLFFFFAMLALSGLALPLVGFFNRRFPTTPPADESVLLRQAVWVGLYGCILIWLQQGQILTGLIALIPAVGLFLVEVFLRMGERARWHPPQESDD